MLLSCVKKSERQREETPYVILYLGEDSAARRALLSVVPLLYVVAST